MGWLFAAEAPERGPKRRCRGPAARQGPRSPEALGTFKNVHQMQGPSELVGAQKGLPRGMRCGRDALRDCLALQDLSFSWLPVPRSQPALHRQIFTHADDAAVTRICERG